MARTGLISSSSLRGGLGRFWSMITDLVCLPKIKRHTEPDTVLHPLDPIPTPSPTTCLTGFQVSNNETARPKVCVLEGHRDDPSWLDLLRPQGSIDKSMCVSDIKEANVIILAVGSVDDPILAQQLSEIPDGQARVIVVSRNFRLKGIPRDRCLIVTANPSPYFRRPSGIDISTREQLPSYRSTTFILGIIANNKEVASDWANQRKRMPESLQVDCHKIILVSNKKPGEGTPVDGYIVIAEKHLDTIELPQEPVPMVGVLKDPDMDALSQLPHMNSSSIVCHSDPIPCLVKRIIFRRLAQRRASRVYT